MDLNSFLSEVFSASANLDFVKNIDVNTEIFLTKGKINLLDGSFLKFYYNSKTNVLSFAWIKEEKRIWGFDSDFIKGWHLHPLENPNDHIAQEQHSISEIISQFVNVYYLINK